MIQKIIARVALDKGEAVPMYQQLGDAICRMAEEGYLKPNEKLPPIRKLAEALGVNNVTVVNAYKYLESKKIVYSAIGSGTYLAELHVKDRPLVSVDVLQRQMQMRLNGQEGNGEIINFAKGSAPAALFPVDAFKELFNQVLERDRGNAFGNEHIQGYGPLREALCDYAAGFGIAATSDRIQVISGAQQGIDIIAKAVLSPGDVVLVESPTYYGAAGAFLSRGAQLVEAPLQEDGLDIARLTALIKAYRPKILYTMPYFQTPTCINTSMEKKRKILELAYQYDFYVMEEDNQSDFNFSETEIVPLKALDYKNKVIYIKSFSRILMPGLRLGFMILPKAALTQVLSAKYTTDIETSGFMQKAFHLFLNSREWDIHMAKMRRMYRERYDAMSKAVRRYLQKGFDYKIPGGGLHFWLALNEEQGANQFCNQLAQRGVVVYPGSFFMLDGRDIPNIRLSFANVEEDRIEEGVRRIGQAMTDRGCSSSGEPSVRG